MKKRVLAVLLTAAMAASLMAGCSTPSTDDSSDSSSDSGEKVFRYAVNTKPTTLDPTKGNSIGDNEIQHAITESLVRTTNGEVTEGIADEWEVSDDGLTYTFHIRDDAKWSDGEQITADDFVYSWQRLLDPETASIYAFIGECLKNGKAIETGEMDPSELGVTAVDDQNLEVTLENPTPYFLSLIGSSGQFAPLRQDVVEEYGTDFAATAKENVYSGPYVLSSSEDNLYTFEPNENYWDKDSINFDRVELNYVENTSTQLAMYEDGELDYVTIPTADVPNYEGEDNTYLNGNVDFYYVNNTADSIVSNKNFRVALNYALDRESYNTLANNDVYQADNRLVFSGLTCGDTTFGEAYESDVYPMSGDTDKALEYLDKAMEEYGVSDASDISIEITTSDAESSKKQAEVVQELWQKALGINVTIRQVTYSEVYGTVLPNDDFEVCMGGWGSDYDDPYSYLELFKSDNSNNSSNYTNEEVDALLEASQTETDESARMDELAQAEQIILEDGAFVPLQQREIHYLIDDDLTGINFFYCSINIDWVYGDVTE